MLKESDNMDNEKFTAKMQEAIQKASQLALSYKHQVIDLLFELPLASWL